MRHYRFNAFWTDCRNYDKAWSEGCCRSKRPPCGVVTSQNVYKFPCVCPITETLDTWYDAVCALPIAWLDVTDIGTHYFKKTSSFLPFATQLGVSHMWGKISPQWHLLRHHLWNRGPNYLNAERLEELLILNRPNRPGEDVKDYVLPHSYKQEWWEWERAKDEFQNKGFGAAPQSFVDENEAVNRMLQVVCRDEIAMGITYKQSKEIGAHKDDRATKRRRKEDTHATSLA